jgi:hypothetical protein
MGTPFDMNLELEQDRSAARARLMMWWYCAPFETKVQAANKRLKFNDNKDNILLMTSIE